MAFNINIFLILAVIALSSLISFWYYKVTVPEISKTKKFFLIIMRAISLSLLLFLALEITISFLSFNTFRPKTFVFIDKSKSLMTDDSVVTKNRIKNILNNLKGDDLTSFSLFTFGTSVRNADVKSFDYNFNDPFTNFESIGQKVKNSGDSVNSVLILSDGNINNGSNSIDIFKDLNIPIYTYGLSGKKNSNDIIVKDVSLNSFIYKGKTNHIEVVLFNDGYAGKKISCKLFDGKNLLEEKLITLSNSGIDRVSFIYKPDKAGMTELEIRTDILQNEVNRFNNSKKISVNVLENKLTIAFISNTPTNDFSIIKSVVASDTNRTLFNYVSLENIENKTFNNSLEKADLFFMIGFPDKNTSIIELNNIVSIIRKKRTPFFILINNYTDLNKLNTLRDFLPYTNSISTESIINAQVKFSNLSWVFINSTNNSEADFWNNLPPVNYRLSKLKLEANTFVIADSRTKEGKLPTIVVGEKMAIKSFSIFNYDIWKWMLQNSEVSKIYFTNFMDNVVKWLSTPSIKNKFVVKSLQPILYENEEIILRAELYDSKFSTINDANIKVKLADSVNTINTIFTPMNNGLYEARVNSIFKNKVNFVAETKDEFGKTIRKSGIIKIEPKQIELMNLGMNENFLKNLAISTGGDFLVDGEVEETINKFEQINNSSLKTIKSSTDIELWQFQYILIIIISLLLIEWLIRKLNYLN